MKDETEQQKAPVEPEAKRKTGFANMDPDRRREVSRSGGKAAQQGGKARRLTSETARYAGRLGGLAMAEKRRSESTSS